ncbi:lipopolysaccharide biosynthesis protein [Burkholderia pseudomultivorans]|uniref:lipopolysaccharide biosynthesis protein n=1 Tax=Burkholderia pseudomultivorans TaxID=1207504 RepID=UPI00188E5552|nr:oligosaccharide flippase family protein [Burkholderia pseudomultivorans]MBF5011904.1 oligosaccharide flippase family protein [Burkholderia pseudomultivorans]
MLATLRNQLRKGTLRSSPIFSGVVANIFNQGITVIVQLASLPIFLHFWGATRYGQWIVISAVPAYFAMSDIGIVSVAINKIGMLHARGEVERANVTLQSAFAGVTGLLLFGTLIGAVFVFLFRSGSHDESWALLLLVATALLNLYSGLFDAAFRVVDRYAAGVFLLSFARLGEWLATVACVAAGGGIVAAAAAACGARAVIQLAILLGLRRSDSGLQWGLSKSSLAELKSLVPQGAAFLGFPLGNALSIQGMTLVVGHFIGMREVVVFNAYRTLSRSITQLITTVSRAVWPRFSSLYARGQHREATELRRKAERTVAFAAVATFVLLIAVSRPLIDFWGRGKLPYQPLVLVCLLFVAVVTSLYQVKLVALMSTNRHTGVSVQFCAISAVAVGVGWALSAIVGMTGPVAAVVVAEIAIFVSVTRAFRGMTPGGI